MNATTRPSTRQFARFIAQRPSLPESRRGGFIVLALFCLIACLVFVCFSVDIGYIEVQKTRMQNAVDAAALAAAQEITAAVANAPQDVGDVTAYALSSARSVAATTAEMNDVYVNSATDVEFGTRSINPQTGDYTITWGTTPANVVKVVARRTEDDTALPDGKLRLFFAGVTGDRYTKVRTSAIAYIEARDIIVVHDFSRSMNFDSQFSDEAVSRLSASQIRDNLAMAWADLNLNLGTFNFDPQYLKMEKTSNGVTTTCTFKYDKLTVTTTGTLQSVKVKYDNNSTTTFNVSGTSANITGTRDIVTAWVTAVPSQQEGSPWSSNSDGISVTASANRKDISVSAGDRLTKLELRFTDGTSQTLTWSWGTGPTSHSYSSGKAVDYFRVYAPSNFLSYIFGANTYFDVPSNNGNSQGQPVEHEYVDNNTNVRAAFGLSNVNYPFPSGSWDEYFNHCRNYSPLANNGYREMYGGLTFTNYLIRVRSSHSETPALCTARVYPFSSIKEGHQMLCNFLEDLGFDDHVGMVSFDTSHRWETILNETGLPYVNISQSPITNNYTAVNNLMKYKQANHYSPSTNMGGGLKDAVSLLDNHRRAQARPIIILMTDGNPNTIDNGESTSLPNGWSWNNLLDYDGDGAYDYYTNDGHRRYVLKQAYEAAQKGYTVHTMSVGMDGDRSLMEAIAHIGGGYFIDIPGGYSVLDMEEDVKAAFHKIAAQVPPPKLLNE